MLSRVTAKNVGDVFLRLSVFWPTQQLHGLFAIVKFLVIVVLISHELSMLCRLIFCSRIKISLVLSHLTVVKWGKH